MGLDGVVLYLPFPTRLNGAAGEAQAASVAWLDRFGLYADAAHRERLVGAGCGVLGGYLAPEADREQLQLAADFATWNVAFDDEYCDEGELGRSPERFVRVLGLLQRSVEVPEEAVFGDRYGVALHDLRVRLEGFGPAEQVAAWAASMRGWFLAEAWKSGNVAGGRTPELGEYSSLVLVSGGGEAWTVLSPLVEGYGVPGRVRADRGVRALTEMACWLLSWDTGLLSWSREKRAGGDGHNAIDVVSRTFGMDFDASVELALLLRDEVMGLFLRVRRRVLDERGSEVERYVGMLERLVRGGVDWAVGSRRYREEAGAVVRVSEDPAALRTGAGGGIPGDAWGPVGWWWLHDPAARERTGRN
ncbi:hypothetical protein SAMN05216251_12777 [Actinacidiphila alni]|uniref:Terpene synthase n=1 Tax=Actinacidiphila alni TaxID=380248 RepID=A0A1I2L895_9ACTN|nr:hypothetical protein [Actinacidiphila alni]SFF75582.1 hypothetical protein SAMN05216251_12777 [Actinacidiphila alni]